MTRGRYHTAPSIIVEIRAEDMLLNASKIGLDFKVEWITKMYNASYGHHHFNFIRLLLTIQ